MTRETHMEWRFDCWYKNDGIPKVKYIIAATKEEAVRDFKNNNDDMGFDEPYIDY